MLAWLKNLDCYWVFYQVFSVNVRKVEFEFTLKGTFWRKKQEQKTSFLDVCNEYLSFSKFLVFFKKFKFILRLSKKSTFFYKCLLALEKQKIQKNVQLFCPKFLFFSKKIKFLSRFWKKKYFCWNDSNSTFCEDKHRCVY